MKTLRNFVGGAWADPRGDELLELVNPATEEVIARFPAGSVADADSAVKAAVAAQPDWAALPVAERVRQIQAWAGVVAGHADELAELERQEMGKPAGIGRTFIDGAVAGLKAAAEQALSYAFEETVPQPGGGSTRIVRHPLGATAVITPWNFPVTMVLGALGPLLAAGNTVVVKPSERSPYSTARLFELLSLPAGVVNLVLGDARAGAPLAAHEDVQLVHFTGSVASGRKIAAAAGERLHRSVLELGGKDPVLVDADVDPVATAKAVAFGAFVNTGQICTSMERIYVHADVAEPFVEALVAEAAGYQAGDVLGPLVDGRQRDLVHRHVTDAVAKGATVRAGGEAPDGPGFFYPATVLTGVEDSMLIMREETFGPVAPVAVVNSFEEGVERASRSRYGLAATVYSNDEAHVAAAGRIPAGVLWVNQWQGGGPERLYEPAGESGMGATGARAAYDAATRPASVHFAAGWQVS
ncbi:aldehyde dehydrogenase [Amycolatopsis acidicola]|uniref:Aldehyde dehydrogenase n=1 Tax=Amycolatopsis acidicola TaxID=2596893 RepID=A0A5N0V480_9PSEU|nr:aldehyde dehydrogenase family protein [Amycolatopsis acidicola]KAA9159807.1 aldehyde dehydrogenase [Amycolatopsis acidicola]